MRMRIAFIGQKGIPATYGGIEDYVEKTSTRLVQRGHQVTVFCRPYYSSSNGTHKGVRLKRRASIPTKHLDAISHSMLCSVESLFGDFDLVNFQALGPSSLSFIPRLIGRTKVVATIHSLDWQRDKWNTWAKRLLRLAQYPSVRFPDKVAVVSQSLKEYFEKKTQKEVVKIPTGVDPPVLRRPDKIRRYGLEKDNFILFLNRLVPEKGCHLLIQAFKKLKTEKKLFIAGDGKFSEDYVNDLKQSGSDRIIFGGYVEEDVLQELYTNCYLYVLPSMVEGMSQSVLKALSYGQAVLVSDIQENLEAVQDCGFTFRNGDTSDLEAKLETLLKRPHLVRADEERRRRYVQDNFSWDRAAEDLENLFVRCLNGKSGTGT
jgi:glycosyltransferase involved in cell wall biosynthesis